jgi:hypothetical protein
MSSAKINTQLILCSRTLKMQLFLSVVLLFSSFIRFVVGVINSSCSKLLEMVYWSSSYLPMWKNMEFKNCEQSSLWKDVYTRRNYISFEGNTCFGKVSILRIDHLLYANFSTYLSCLFSGVKKSFITRLNFYPSWVRVELLRSRIFLPRWKNLLSLGKNYSVLKA